jgi:hypothetical protein
MKGTLQTCRAVSFAALLGFAACNSEVVLPESGMSAEGEITAIGVKDGRVSVLIEEFPSRSTSEPEHGGKTWFLIVPGTRIIAVAPNGSWRSGSNADLLVGRHAQAAISQQDDILPARATGPWIRVDVTE